MLIEDVYTFNYIKEVSDLTKDIDLLNLYDKVILYMDKNLLTSVNKDVISKCMCATYYEISKLPDLKS